MNMSEVRPYTIIVTTEAKGNVLYNTLDSLEIIPYTHLAGIYGKNQNIGIQIRAGSVENIAASIDELTGWLRAIRKVEPGEENDFEITTNETLGSVLDRNERRVGKEGRLQRATGQWRDM